MIIQRIQSLFLLCTAIVNALLFLMPVATITIPNNFTYEFYTAKVVQIGQPSVFIAWNWMSMILNIATILLATATIFVHKKKTQSVKPTLFLQLRLCITNMILQLGLVTLLWLQLQGRAGDLNANWQANISFIFPVIGIILTWLALRYIVKDIALLKSFDRIR